MTRIESIKMREIKCPHCECQDAERVTGSDELGWTMVDDSILKELWQCDECGKYYFVYYQIIKITPLIEQEGENNDITK